MKDKILELLEKCYEVCNPNKCEKCKYHGVPCCGDHIRADLLTANGLIIPERTEDKASLDYEKEYLALLDKHNLLYADYQAMESEFIRLRAQMDVVCLIFGGK